MNTATDAQSVQHEGDNAPAKTSAKVKERVAKTRTKAEDRAEAEKVIAQDEKRIALIAKGVTADGKKLSAMQDAFFKLHDKWGSSLDVLVASMICHAVQHGNVTPMNQLMEKLGTRKTPVRTNAIKTYFIAKGPVDWDEDNTTLVYSKEKAKLLKAEYRKNELAFKSSLVREPFYVFAQQGDFKAFDLKAELGRLVDRARTAKEREDKAKKAGRAVIGETDIEGLEMVEKTFHKIQAE